MRCRSITRTGNDQTHIRTPFAQQGMRMQQVRYPTRGVQRPGSANKMQFQRKPQAPTRFFTRRHVTAESCGHSITDNLNRRSIRYSAPDRFLQRTAHHAHGIGPRTGSSEHSTQTWQLGQSE
jgi:hypothetical protein